MPTILDTIRPGDRVTFTSPQGQSRTGRAVFCFPTHCVLNMGGRYGTPAVCDERSITRVKPITK